MNYSVNDVGLMRQALEVAHRALRTDDVPVGALVVNEHDEVIASGVNTREGAHDPVGHAEINALCAAANVTGSWRLDGLTLVVNLEPCVMCAGAIIQSRISRLVFGAFDDKAGAVGSVWDVVRDPRTLHQPEVVAGVLADESAAVLQEFFASRRGR